MSAGTLYEIADALAEIAAELVEAGGALTPEMEASLDAWEGALVDKVDAIGGLIQDLTRGAEAAKAERERLDALCRARENAAARLKEYVLRELSALGRDRVDTPRFRVSVAGNGGKVPVHLACDPADLPAAWRTETVSYRADTDAIRAALEAGDRLPFASLGERGKHLRLR